MEVNSAGILYPEFAPGEVLTSIKLNKLVEYLSTEEADTRVFLIGRGIFYGLEVSYDSNANAITIRPGAGLSSDGELFALENEYTFKKAKTETINIAKKNVPAQLLIRDEKVEDGEPLVINKDSIIVMQIHSGTEPDNNCLQRYDRTGRTNKSEIRVAIISKDVFTDSIIKEWGNRSKADDMMELLIPFLHRFGNIDVNFPEDQQAISFDGFTSWQAVKDNFYSVCKEGAANIASAYQEAYTTYAASLGFTVNPNPFTNLSNDLTDKLNEIYEANGYLLPYFYDYLKDLVNAGIEFLDTTIDAPEFSYPDKDSFEGYISLGNVHSPHAGDKYRMGLYRLPFTYADKEMIDKPKMLMNRMISLAQVKTVFINEQQLKKQKPCVTPSAGLGFPLSARPIPFYLNGKEELQHVWNYGASQRKRLSSIPGMDDNIDRKLLLRDMDAFSFFKIKGHAGYPMTVAKTEIEKLRKDLHLPFDIKVLFSGDEIMEGGIFSDYKGYFSDLRLQWESAYASLMCDESCGRKILELIRSEWNGADDYSLFESIGYFFIKYEFDPEPSKWEERATGFCRKLCEEKDPQCCLNYLKFFYDLYLEYKARKEEILDELFFHRFAKKHPGLEHNAGVYKGGTLVLVCAMELQQDELVDRISKFFQINQDSQRWTKNESFQINRDTQNLTTKEFFQNMLTITVVADFCLPYICCSKRPSIRAEFYHMAPIADFVAKDREPITEEGELKGQKITIENRSKNADTYSFSIFKHEGELLKKFEVTNNPITFDLLFTDGNIFNVRLDAMRGGLTSTKEQEFDITSEPSLTERKKSFDDRANEYEKVLEDIGKKDKEFAKLGKFTQTEELFELPKKNLNDGFRKLIHTLAWKYDDLPKARKGLVLQLARLALSFYVDKQIFYADVNLPKKENEFIKSATKFIISKKSKTEALLPDWDADSIAIGEYKEVVEAYKKMME